MILVCIYGIIILIIYQVFRPLIFIIKLKIQYRDQAIISFFPIFGDLLKLRKYTKIYGEPYLKFQQLFGKPPYPIFRLSNLMNQPLIGINDPEYYKVILQDHQYFKKLNNLLHNGLVYSGMVFSDGIKWHSQRTLFQDQFQYDKIISKLPMMNQLVDEELQSYDGRDLQKKMFQIASQVIGNAFFGQIKLDFLEDLPEIFNYLAGLKFSNPFILLKSVILGQKSWYYLTSKREKEIDKKIQRVKKCLENLINERLSQMKQNTFTFDSQNKDFLQIHLDYYLNQDVNKKTYKMTIDDIIQQFITFYFAGADTTAGSSSSTLALLAQYPKYQQEIYEEIVDVINNKQVTIEHIQKCVKLNAFIKETLRLRGPVQNLIPRRVLQDIQIKDLKLKKGWFVVIDNFINRGSEKYIDDPLTFNYHRWMVKQNPFKNDNGYNNIPFSGGARNCIGQHLALLEIKVIVIKMLLKCELRLKEPLRWNMKFVYQYYPDNIIEFKLRNC